VVLGDGAVEAHVLVQGLEDARARVTTYIADGLDHLQETEDVHARAEKEKMINQQLIWKPK
jgi:hypothetical protein